MPAAIVMRHAAPHFDHVFSGDGYSSGYYSYMWSEVMDADAFAAFRETGDVFDPAVAARLAEHILAPAARATRPNSTSRSAAGCRGRGAARATRPDRRVTR